MSTWTVLLRMVLAAAASLPLMGCNSGRPVPYRIERTWALVDAETASRAAFLGLPVQANPAALMARRCDASELAKLLEEAGDRKFFWSGKQGFVGRLIPGAVSPAHADTWTLSVQPGFPAACGPEYLLLSVGGRGSPSVKGGEDGLILAVSYDVHLQVERTQLPEDNDGGVLRAKIKFEGGIPLGQALMVIGRAGRVGDAEFYIIAAWTLQHPPVL